MDLRSETPAGVVQECYAIWIAPNAIRMAMLDAARATGIDPLELSFTYALTIIRQAIPQMRQAKASQLRHLYKCMLLNIAQGRLPPRDGRINPREVKTKHQSNFARKRPGGPQPCRPEKPFIEVVVILE